MKTFEDTKTELLAKAKACGACKKQYSRAKKVTTIRGLAKVVTDNWGFACSHQLITVEMLNAIPTSNDPSTYRISILLQNMPEFIGYYDLVDLTGGNLDYIISAQPHLIEYFKDDLYKLDNYDIHSLLFDQPQLIAYFPNYKNPLF